MRDGERPGLIAHRGGLDWRKTEPLLPADPALDPRRFSSVSAWRDAVQARGYRVPLPMCRGLATLMHEHDVPLGEAVDLLDRHELAFRIGPLFVYELSAPEVIRRRTSQARPRMARPRQPMEHPRPRVWTDVVSRSSLGINVFRVRGTRASHEGPVIDVIRDLGLEWSRGHVAMFASHTVAVGMLDGGWVAYSGYGLPPVPSGQWIVGFRALRLVLDRVGVPQPRRLKGETSRPASAELVDAPAGANSEYGELLLRWGTPSSCREVATELRRRDNSSGEAVRG